MLRFALLVYRQVGFANTVDENLKYPLGPILIDRLVKRYGTAAPHTLLRTLAREDFPRDLDGYVLWQTAFQLAGFDLDLVLDDYARHLEGLEAPHARQIALAAPARQPRRAERGIRDCPAFRPAPAG